MTPFTEDMCERAAKSLGLCAGSSSDCDVTGTWTVAGDFSSTTTPDGNSPPDGCYYYDFANGSYGGNAYWNSATDFATAASPDSGLLVGDQI
jgi:hypothetical protein